MVEDPKAQRLFSETFNKTRSRKIPWEPTADENTFVAALGGRFTLTVTRYEERDAWDERSDVIALVLKENDRELARVTGEIDGVEWREMEVFFGLVQRQANRVDEKLDSVFAELSKL
jgi:hypothetical protein